MFYDLSRVLSYNAYFNFLLGERGVGKTFSTKKFVINKFLKHNEQFIYLRRYKPEIKEAKDTYFNDIISKFPNHSFETKNYKFKIDDKTARICNTTFNNYYF